MTPPSHHQHTEGREVLAARIETLFGAIQHGDVEHREWLEKAITDHFDGKPVEPARGSGRKETEIAYLSNRVKALEAALVLVSEQANDEGLWFQPTYVSEDYLQKALRRLHEVVEGKTSEECARALTPGEKP